MDLPHEYIHDISDEASPPITDTGHLPAINILDISKPLPLLLTITCPITHHPVTTSLNPRSWNQLLSRYENKQWAYRLVHDIIYGVNIGYQGPRLRTVQARNFLDSDREKQAVDKDIKDEAGLGRIIGPFTKPPWKHYFCSPLKTVAKKGNPNKLRVVHHLSYPHHDSINSHTVEWPCHLAKFSKAVEMVCELGNGCFMAKMDIKAAYRAIPIRPADWPLLGMQWEDQYYFHTSLPFGLRSSCHLWERYATAAEWITIHEFKVPNLIHYVDDYFTADKGQHGCEQSLQALHTAFHQLGLIIATDKTEGPTTRLVFLGILIDSEQMTISLDEKRIRTIMALLHEWSEQQTCSLDQLRSLVGTLAWASNVVQHGRTFLQHLRDLEREHRNTPRPSDTASIPLSPACKEDILWWQHFTDGWNGISMLVEQQWMDRTDTLQPHTDACMEGYGAVCGNQWFHGQWTDEQQVISSEDGKKRDSMPWKVLFAIVAAALTWGHQWTRKRVIFYTDCQPVVQALTKGASRTTRIMQLIRYLQGISGCSNHPSY